MTQQEEPQDERRAQRDGRHGEEPIWTRPEPGTRRATHTREEIADAAIAIADAEGFEAVSMRRIARELGAGTMTLYHYVRTKHDLLTLMDNAIMGEIIVPDDELPLDDWRAALRAIARHTRNAFLRHAWAFEALRGFTGAPNGMRHFEQSLAAVASTGLDTKGQIELIMLTDDYVFGYVARELQMSDFASIRELPPAIATFLRDQLATGAFPHIEGFAERDDDVSTGFMRFAEIAAAPGRFDRGLEQLLDGVALDLERRQASGKPARRTG